MNTTQLKVFKPFRQGLSLTRRELEKRTGLRTGTICGRVSELIENGKIEKCGTRYDRDAKRNVELLRIKIK